MTRPPLALLFLMPLAVLVPVSEQAKLTPKKAGKATSAARVETSVAAFSAGPSTGGRINNQHH